MSSKESFSGLGKTKSWSVEGNDVKFSVGSNGTESVVSFTIFENGMVRYRLEPKGDPRFRSAHLPMKLDSSVKPAASENAGSVVIKAAGIIVKIDLDAWKASFHSGTANLAELSDDVNARSDFVSLPTGHLLDDGKISGARVNFELSQHRSFFGLGEKATVLDKKGQRITVWNENPYGSGTEKAYKSIPLLVSNGGYGLFLNETVRSVWDIGKKSNFSLSIEVDNPGFDLFIIFGTDMRAILRKYSDFTVKAPLPPRWSFGLWISPFGNYLDAGASWQQKEFLEFAALVRKKGLPGDVIHLDPYWMGKYKKLCDLQWDSADYPDPKAFIEGLAGLGFRLCLWEHPYIEKGSDTYNHAAEKSYLIKRKDGTVYDYNIVIVPAERRMEENLDYKENFYALGGVVDFTNPEAAEWYKSLHRPLIELGVATFKTDFGEVIPYDGWFSNGFSGRENHNLFAYLYNKTVWEVQKEYTDRPMLWGRSGYSGSQAFPVQWSGDPTADFRSLESTIRSGLSYGFSGVPFWSYDMGAFKGRPTPEVYTRWSQVGALLSHSRFHGTTARMPWDYGEAADKAVTKFIKLRYSLLPFIYGTAAECCESGLPFIRAPCLEFEHDPGAYFSQTEFLMGDSILVVPVLNGAGEAEYYLPAGPWYDFWTGTRLQGPLLERRTCALDELPMFVRGGSVIVSTAAEEQVLDFWKTLTVDIYGEADRTAAIPEENGLEPSRIKVSARNGKIEVQASGPKMERDWIFRFHDISEPRNLRTETGRDLSTEYDAAKKVAVMRMRQSDKASFVFEVT